MKKINTLIAIFTLIFVITGSQAQTYPLHKFSLHIHGGYTTTLPDMKGVFPSDLIAKKNPTPYFINNGFNFGLDGKYLIDKKKTFALILTATYSMLSSGDKGVTALDTNSILGIGEGTWRTDMNIITIGVGAEYEFAPNRPANPFVNLQFTTNIIGGKTKFDRTAGNVQSYSADMNSAIRFGAQFGAGVDVKLSRSVGIVIGGRYAFANLFGKDSTGGSYVSGSYGLNDKETTIEKSKKMAYLQFFAGMSFYFGMKPKPIRKK